MAKFYNPYQFINTKKVTDQLTDFAEIKAGETHIRHDYWKKDTLSGRIVCQLKTVTPIMLGGLHSKNRDRTTQVSNYRIPQNEQDTQTGEIAIPANSLRGMISTVAEIISNSSMRVLSDDLYYKNFKNQVENNENILPWGKGRSSLTPVEALFGVVGENKDVDNLSSRVCFYDARSNSVDVSLLLDCTLKILSSPNDPVSPSMYFHNKDNTVVKGEDLNSDDVFPNGRKRYLHQTNNKNLLKWETKSRNARNNNLKVKCSPIDSKQNFYFHIDFENLSEDELELLILSVEPDLAEGNTEGQNNGFMHKIGLGKPLGLGSICIDIAGVFFIDRVDRYSNSGISGDCKYSYAELIDKDLCDTEDIRKLYSNELLVLIKTDLTKDRKFNINQSNIIDNESFKSLCLVGNPAFLDADYPICYPFSENSNQSPFNEDGLFKWFSNEGKGQFLGYVTSKIPVLSSGKCVSSRSGNKKAIEKTPKIKPEDLEYNIKLEGLPYFHNRLLMERWEKELIHQIEADGEVSVLGVLLFEFKKNKKRNYGYASLDTQAYSDAVNKLVSKNKITVFDVDVTIIEYKKED